MLADLNGDQQIDLASASSGLSDDGGYAQEVRVTLGASHETSFHFQSRGATVELSSRDVDGDHDGDLIVFEPFRISPSVCGSMTAQVPFTRLLWRISRRYGATNQGRPGWYVSSACP